MNWARLDVSFFRNPKVADLSDAAKLLYLELLLHSVEHLTDGAISLATVGRHALTEERRQAIEELVRARLWKKAKRGFQIHDFHDYQALAGDVIAKRKKTRERVRNWRRGNADVTLETARGAPPESVRNSAATQPPDDDETQETPEIPGIGNAVTNSVRTPLVTRPQDSTTQHSTGEDRRIPPAMKTDQSEEIPAEPQDRTAHDLGLLDRALALEQLDAKAREAFTDMRATIASGRYRVLTSGQRTWVLDVLEDSSPLRKIPSGTMSPRTPARDDPPSDRVQDFVRRQTQEKAGAG